MLASSDTRCNHGNRSGGLNLPIHRGECTAQKPTHKSRNTSFYRDMNMTMIHTLLNDMLLQISELVRNVELRDYSGLRRLVLRTRFPKSITKFANQWIAVRIHSLVVLVAVRRCGVESGHCWPAVLSRTWTECSTMQRQIHQKHNPKC